MKRIMFTNKPSFFIRMIFKLFNFLIEFLVKAQLMSLKKKKPFQALSRIASNDYLLLSTPIIRECIIQAHLWPIEACYVALDNVQRDLDRTYKSKLSASETKARNRLIAEHGYWSGMITYTALQFFSLLNYYNDEKKILFFSGISNKHQLLKYLRAFDNLIPKEQELYKFWLIQKGVDSVDLELRIFTKYQLTKDAFAKIIADSIGKINTGEVVAEVVKQPNPTIDKEEVKL